MQLHRIRVHRIALILAIVTITCRISWASTQCKTVVMNVHMKRCRLGAGRLKRGLERFDLLKHGDILKYDEKSKRQEGLDYSKVNDWSSHSTPQKRQQSLRQITDDIIRPMEYAADSAIRAFGTGYYNNPSPSKQSLSAGSSHLSPALHLFDKMKSRFIHLDYNDDLRLDLDDKELDELYNDIYERRPRSSKEEAWKAFLETASKCCQNVNKCLKETTHIPCLT